MYLHILNTGFGERVFQNTNKLFHKMKYDLLVSVFLPNGNTELLSRQDAHRKLFMPPAHPCTKPEYVVGLLVPVHCML